jgi:hypothetical protein
MLVVCWLDSPRPGEVGLWSKPGGLAICRVFIIHNVRNNPSLGASCVGTVSCMTCLYVKCLLARLAQARRGRFVVRTWWIGHLSCFHHSQCVHQSKFGCKLCPHSFTHDMFVCWLERPRPGEVDLWSKPGGLAICRVFIIHNVYINPSLGASCVGTVSCMTCLYVG